MTLTQILEYNFISLGDYTINLLDILEVLIILVFARLAVSLLTNGLRRILTRRRVDIGRQYAATQFLKYIIYTFTILAILQAIGVSLSLLWAGSAALLVGLGLGLQQTFNDFFSGILLLMEGSVEVGDILEISGLVGRVEQIGMRTSKIQTRDNIDLIIPNSKLVSDNVINWSHNNTPTRFNVPVGVAYSSDVDVITQLLLDAADSNTKVLKEPAPSVQFVGYGDSSLDFLLYFYSYEFWRIEAVKSELRFTIFSSFREQGVEIPFPQRDLWLRNTPAFTAENLPKE